jgi:hypothetical protein
MIVPFVPGEGPVVRKNPRPSPQGRGGTFVRAIPRLSMVEFRELPAVVHCLRTLSLVAVGLGPTGCPSTSSAAVVAENLFLRKQLALFQEGR